MKQRIKLYIILGVELVAILAILLLIFLAGKRSYTVVFDLNGGTLISGDTEQRVTQGLNATPPTVTKDGCYFLRWSTSYQKVTKDLYITAIWEYDTTEGIIYSVEKNANYCEISGCYSELSGDVYIGAYYNGLKVMGIKEGAFADCDRIERVFLLDGILKIEDNAFSGCKNLKSIEIPSTVVEIGDNAFRGCESLQEVKLPESLDTLGEGAFSGCQSLESVEFGDKLEVIGDNAFAGCESLQEVKLPASLISLGEYAFSDCVSLQKVEFLTKTEPIEEINEEISPLADSPLDEEGEEETETKTGDVMTRIVGAEVIGAYAFFGCEALETVILPYSLVEIGEGAFSGLTALKYIFIPKSVAIVGAGAFSKDTAVYVTFSEDSQPEGFDLNWCDPDTEITFDYVLSENEE